MYTPRLLEAYRNQIVPEMVKAFGYKNSLEAPKLQKIVINVGLGEATQDIKMLEAAQNELAAITGQKPLTTRAKKSIANFKIRKGLPIGCKVTLRRAMRIGLRNQVRKSPVNIFFFLSYQKHQISRSI